MGLPSFLGRQGEEGGSSWPREGLSLSRPRPRRQAALHSLEHQSPDQRLRGHPTTKGGRAAGHQGDQSQSERKPQYFLFLFLNPEHRSFNCSYLPEALEEGRWCGLRCLRSWSGKHWGETWKSSSGESCIGSYSPKRKWPFFPRGTGPSQKP